MTMRRLVLSRNENVFEALPVLSLAGYFATKNFRILHPFRRCQKVRTLPFPYIYSRQVIVLLCAALPFLSAENDASHSR